MKFAKCQHTPNTAETGFMTGTQFCPIKRDYLSLRSIIFYQIYRQVLSRRKMKAWRKTFVKGI